MTGGSPGKPVVVTEKDCGAGKPAKSFRGIPSGAQMLTSSATTTVAADAALAGRRPRSRVKNMERAEWRFMDPSHPTILLS
jgi:hypothetical protein